LRGRISINGGDKKEAGLHYGGRLLKRRGHSKSSGVPFLVAQNHSWETLEKIFLISNGGLYRGTVEAFSGGKTTLAGLEQVLEKYRAKASGIGA